MVDIMGNLVSIVEAVNELCVSYVFVRRED